MNRSLNFSKLFKKANILSLIAVIASVLFISIKGLNYGIDFKGGTLIEIRSENKNIGITDIRDSLSNMEVGDINIKEFGKKGDFLIKIEKNLKNDENFTTKIKNNISEKTYGLK